MWSSSLPSMQDSVKRLNLFLFELEHPHWYISSSFVVYLKHTFAYFLYMGVFSYHSNNKTNDILIYLKRDVISLSLL